MFIEVNSALVSEPLMHFNIRYYEIPGQCKEEIIKDTSSHNNCYFILIDKKLTVNLVGNKPK